MRISKTVNGIKTNYYYSGSQLIAEETNGNIRVYVYDASGSPIGMQVYNATGDFSNEWYEFWFEKNLQGDVVAVWWGYQKYISYTYDAWGNFTTQYYIDGYSDLGVYDNPFLYRGYYYDRDLGLYYLQSRYYDSNTGRFISADSYVNANGDIVGFNMYAYCSNNPVMFTDETGEGILTFIIVSAIVGAIVGGVSGGVTSYNAAKEEGTSGAELFLETMEGVLKGAAVGTVAGTVIGATAGAIAIGGMASVGATITVTSSITLAAKVTEVGSLQCKKSINDGKSGWQVADDVISSIFNNTHRILSPIGTKTVTTVYDYILCYKAAPVSCINYLTSGTRVVSFTAYVFALYSWKATYYSITTNDPIERAKERGYSLI